MNSPQNEQISIWNTVQELVSLEKDIYKVNERDARNNDKENWRTEYREHLRSKATKRQQLLESLERGLKSCGLDTLRQTRTGTTDHFLPEKDNISRNDNTWKQQTEETHESQSRQVLPSTPREIDSVTCRLDFETRENRDEKLQRTSNCSIREQEVQTEYIQLKRQYDTLLIEKEALEQHCHILENWIQTQRKHIEYYEEELEEMSKKRFPPLKEKAPMQNESKENQSDESNEKAIVWKASRQLQNITESIQEQMQLRYSLQEQVDSLEQHKEALESSVHHLQTTKKELQDNIRKMESKVQKLEQKKQISLDTLHSMFEQIQTEVSRCTRGKYQVTQLATDVLHTISSHDRVDNICQQPESTMNTNAITIKAISKLQEKIHTLEDALIQSQEETNRYKKALHALREEHEMTIQRYGKEFQMLEELYQVRLRQCRSNKGHKNRPILSQLR
ncbi:hypothetical protein GpartN1_g1830.t1 [Galdieria partita]|uniref:Uncharacterized protein n=1 Tax=Galdieria partita TaxID=83374 RepID=A0A9C7PTI4_9RHOD|nr:hypothetical protein GpartN1_g1830.t1 [Galdieria partita]